ERDDECAEPRTEHMWKPGAIRSRTTPRQGDRARGGAEWADGDRDPVAGSRRRSIGEPPGAVELLRDPPVDGGKRAARRARVEGSSGSLREPSQHAVVGIAERDRVNDDAGLASGPKGTSEARRAADVVPVGEQNEHTPRQRLVRELRRRQGDGVVESGSLDRIGRKGSERAVAVDRRLAEARLGDGAGREGDDGRLVG